jgi:hypothetical protein
MGVLDCHGEVQEADAHVPSRVHPPHWGEVHPPSGWSTFLSLARPSTDGPDSLLAGPPDRPVGQFPLDVHPPLGVNLAWSVLRSPAKFTLRSLVLHPCLPTALERAPV